MKLSKRSTQILSVSRGMGITINISKRYIGLKNEGSIYYATILDSDQFVGTFIHEFSMVSPSHAIVRVYIRSKNKIPRLHAEMQRLALAGATIQVSTQIKSSRL